MSAAVSNALRFPLKKVASVCCFIVALLEGAHTLADTIDADGAQAWRLASEKYDWQQAEPNAQVKIVGKGVADADGNLYFVGSKTYITETDSINDQNIFIARIDADDSLAWTKEFGTNETDAANFVTLVNETSSEDGTVSEMLYVVGTTWGYMDEGAYALNGFGQFGGRDVVLLKLNRDGEKIWARQFGTTANGFGYGVTLDSTFNSLLLSGGCVTDQMDTVVEVDVQDVLEARQPFSLYESQMMEPNTRTSVRTQQYDFAASFNSHGDLLDFAMDGGMTLTPRRQRIEENGVRGEYSVVLNRRPLNDVRVRAEVVQLANVNGTKVQQLRLPNGTFYEVVFTQSNWNREQSIRVIAVDDEIAEGVHYSVITHSSLSLDPNFNGSQTPFLYGRNIMMQVEDNDFASIKLSRAHMYIGEGGLTDIFEVALNSRPWYPVFVAVLALHPNQTRVNEPLLTFMPATWNISQTVIVSAIDDPYSEVEFGGLHYGGQTSSCFEIPNCDLTNESDCLLPDFQAQEFPVRVCDITSDCNFALGNGACIAQVFSGVETIPARFGRPVLNPSLHDITIDEASMAYTALQGVLHEQEIDGTVSTAPNSTDLTYVSPLAELRGFVLSFLGLLNLDQVQKLGKSSKRTLHSVCAGIGRLETHRWAFEEWPSGYVDRVLRTVLQMFPGVVDERRLWNCGASVFRPGNSIDVSIWDNDPGVTLSTTPLTIRESAEGSTNGSTATYLIVLNAAPSTGGNSLRVVKNICREANSDACGFWGNDFSTIAPVIYNEESSTNISIAIIGNSQITVSPSVVTFTARNWFIPQLITLQADDDDMTEADATYTITHRVQNSPHGYTNATAFWFRGTFQPAPSLLFPRGATGGDTIPYNMIPTMLHSPSHQYINVAVEGNDKAGVQIVVDQPESVVTTKESADKID